VSGRFGVGVQSPPRRLVVRVRLIIDEEAAMRLNKLYELKSALWLASAAAAAAAALCAPAAALAQVAPAPDEAGSAAATAVSQVVVTANRAVMPASQVGQAVTVLTAPQIQQDQETSLSDILDRTPGVTVARTGGPGETTSVFIRGADSDQTVTLVDGVKLNDPTDPGTGYDFANLIAGDVSRVEVLRGPQSTLYGSEAIGGVVNVVTADATRPFEANLRAEGGSFGEALVSGGVGGKDGPADWRLSGYSDQTKGVPCFDEEFGGRRPCAYHTDGFSGRFRYDLTPNLQFDQRAYYSWSRADFDGYDTPTGAFGDDEEYGHTQQWIDYTGINLSLFDGRLKNRLAYEYNAIDHDNQDPQQPGTTTTFLAHGRTDTIEYEGTYAIAPGYQAVFGAQSERSSMFAWSPAYEPAPNRAHDTINSGYAQITGEVLQSLTLTGGVRYDDQTKVGDHVTGQASAAWRLNDGNTILRASWGQGFKAPSLYQLYSEYGNLTLRPEEANGWDAGVEQHFFDGRVVVQGTYFGRDTRNLIDFVSCYGITVGPCATNTVGGYYANVARAEAEGAELQARWQATKRLSLSANYTFDDSEDRSPGSPTEGYQLARRPKNTANVDAGYVWPIKLRTDLVVRYAGESWDDDAHTELLKAYTLVDLRASYPLRDGVELYGRIENLTDQHYETTYQYGTLGRAAYAGVRLTY
jgi:vitamin B12 transporter